MLKTEKSEKKTKIKGYFLLSKLVARTDYHISLLFYHKFDIIFPY